MVDGREGAEPLPSDVDRVAVADGTRGDASLPTVPAILERWRSTPPPDEATMPEWSERFVSAIEAEIVPRLLTLTAPSGRPYKAAEADLVTAVAEAAVAGETRVVEQYLACHLISGGTIGDGLLNIIAPAARLLGVDWENDTRDFMEVTIGLGTLHQVLLGLADPGSDESLPNRRILLGRTPGEDHTLGLAIVDHFFRVARWDVQYEPHADRAALVDAVSRGWFACVGLTLGFDTLAEEARKTIKAVRRESTNRGVRVLVGGPAFDRQADLVTIIGADAVARDGRSAVGIANGWLSPAGRFR